MATIGTNLAALTASFYLSNNNNSLTASIAKLSSGSRLSDPSEDAAGVAVSGKLDAAIKRIGAAVEGSQDVISFAQTTDGFLSTVQQQLTRMSELAQRATNGAFGSSDRQNYNTEFTRIRDQINTVLNNAKFNGQTIFLHNTSIVISIDAEGDTDTFSQVNLTNVTSVGINGLTIGTTTSAISAIASITNALQTVTTKRAEVNADISKYNFYIQNLNTQNINIQAANSRIKDLDVAQETTTLAKENILLQASTSMLAQANASQQTILQLLR
jgi:flagellin